MRIILSSVGAGRGLGIAIAATLVLGACSTGPAAPGGVRVVAAENFWGSLTAQIAGPDASVTSIVTQPDADPHDYEPTPRDARAFADATARVENGRPGTTRGPNGCSTPTPATDGVVLDVGRLPRHSRRRQSTPVVFPRRRRHIHQAGHRGSRTRRSRAPRRVRATRPRSHQRAGSPRSTAGSRASSSSGSRTRRSVPRRASCRSGPTHSVLKLRTPESFVAAVSEGNEPTAADKATVRRADPASPDQGLRLQRAERHARRFAASSTPRTARTSRS